MKPFPVLTLGLSLFLCAMGSATLLAQTAKTILEFNFTNGQLPDSATFDPSGNLWTVQNGGGITNTYCQTYGCGTIIEFTRSSTSWTPKIVHEFRGGNDGIYPSGNLYFDAQGNAYGTTYQGGASPCNCGTVYELSPSGSGWKETILYHFDYNKNHKDGSTPLAGVIADAAGNLYGTTQDGGLYGTGTVFELSKNPHGYWVEHILYNFQFNGTSGFLPYAPLVIDAHGNLYGTTDAGGTNESCGGTTGCGIVFELSPAADGTWTYQTIYNFQATPDANRSQSGLALDASGNLYGVTLYGGSTSLNLSLGGGAVFELSPNSSGGWTESVLYSFGASQTDGYNPVGKLVIDASGNLYGVTQWGGKNQWGTVYELSPSSSGTWTETQLYNFTKPSGLVPNSGLAVDGSGNFYGTTLEGGDTNGICGQSLQGCGVIYELQP